MVSLNDTEELSSTEEEEEIGEGEEEDAEAEDKEEEDSDSEVEIIEEVKGNGTQQHLYLQDLQTEDQFLREQAAAVLSLVTDPQLKVRPLSFYHKVFNWFSSEEYTLHYFCLISFFLFDELFITY